MDREVTLQIWDHFKQKYLTGVTLPDSFDLVEEIDRENNIIHATIKIEFHYPLKLKRIEP